MPHTRSLHRFVLGTAIVTLAAAGCSGGDDISASGLSGFTITQASQPTQTQASAPTASDTAETATASETATGEPTGTDGTTGEVTATTTDDPSDGTTLPDPTTTGVDPTTTGVDPSTTTNVDPSTTTNVDPSTTTGEETTDDPMPPMKDPQPVMGMYEHCLAPEACDPPSNVCLQLNDANMNITDGYCTVICKGVADCGPKPNAPATLDCFLISAQDKICGLKCTVPSDCPTGMVCTNLALPNMAQGSYCI